MRSSVVKQLAKECGFELSGITPACPSEDAAGFLEWVSQGMAGTMSYLTDHRASVRTDPRQILPSARSVISLAKSYNKIPNEPNAEAGSGRIARYAHGEDYHDVLKKALNLLVERMRAEFGDFENRACVDTAPLLERSYARMAGLGWIGKNTCLINQQHGSYVFLAELLVSLEFEPDTPAPYRCGTCTRCIDACPTDALVAGGYVTQLDSRRCISYLTIELRGSISEELRGSTGDNVFGCDICQDVCPWNRKAAPTTDSDTEAALPLNLEHLARMSPEDFRTIFRKTPVWRTKYSGFLRNVTLAMANSGETRYLPLLETLAGSPDNVVAEHARWASSRLHQENPETHPKP